METINSIVSPFSLVWKWGALSVINIVVPLLIIFYFNFSIKIRYRILNYFVFKDESKTNTCNSLMPDLELKILKKNKDHHLISFFIFCLPLFFLSFIKKEEWGTLNLILAIIISATLFIVSCTITKIRLKNYRAKLLKM